MYVVDPRCTLLHVVWHYEVNTVCPFAKEKKTQQQYHKITKQLPKIIFVTIVNLCKFRDSDLVVGKEQVLLMTLTMAVLYSFYYKP